MTELELEVEADADVFTDELSDEALDRDIARGCISSVWCKVPPSKS